MNHNDGQQGQKGRSAMDDFSIARAEWKAAGCPADHRYMTTDWSADAAPIEPLAIPGGRALVELAAALTPPSVFPWS